MVISSSTPVVSGDLTSKITYKKSEIKLTTVSISISNSHFLPLLLISPSEDL